jgi:hypothetical protein
MTGLFGFKLRTIKPKHVCHLKRRSFGGFSVIHYSLRQCIKRTDDRAQQLSCHLCVSHRCLKVTVTKQYLNHFNIHIILQQVGGKAMPESVHRDAFLNASYFSRRFTTSAKLTRRHMVNSLLAGKEPATF